MFEVNPLITQEREVMLWIVDESWQESERQPTRGVNGSADKSIGSLTWRAESRPARAHKRFHIEVASIQALPNILPSRFPRAPAQPRAKRSLAPSKWWRYHATAVETLNFASNVEFPERKFHSCCGVCVGRRIDGKCHAERSCY
jgi:hypothetical protein